MIPIKISVTRKGTPFDARTWKEIIKESWNSAGILWHKNLLNKHFTQKGAAEYRYQKRSWRYTKRKQKKFGHRKPLVYTGELKRHVKRVEDVRANSKGARVVLHGPRYLYQYRKDLNAPDKAFELQQISKADAAALAAWMDQDIQKKIDSEREYERNLSAGHRL